jgi:hypothetical protein
MWAVLLISIDGLSSHRFASSGFKDFSALSLISTLLGDIMVAAFVQKGCELGWIPELQPRPFK